MIDIHCSCELWEKKISMFSIYRETLPEFYSYFCNSAQPLIKGPLEEEVDCQSWVKFFPGGVSNLPFYLCWRLILDLF